MIRKTQALALTLSLSIVALSPALRAADAPLPGEVMLPLKDYLTLVESVERRYGLVNRLPVAIEWLSVNGSPYTAEQTRAFAREIGLLPPRL